MAKQKKKHEEEVLFDLVEAGQSTQGFIQKYQYLILGGVAAILILVGGYFAYKLFYLAPKEKEAINEMYKAELRFEQDSFALALENPGDGYLGFLDIADDYKMTNAGNLANYYAGVSYLRLGRYDAAIVYLKDFKPAGEITPILKYGTLGDAYSEKGEMDNAISFYKKAVNSEDNEFITPYYLNKLGMLLLSLQRNEEAEPFFKRIVEDYPSSSQANSVGKYISE